MPKFTDRFIRSFAPLPGAKDRLAFDSEVKGLALRATAAGGRTFLVQWTVVGTGERSGNLSGSGVQSQSTRHAKKIREPLGQYGSVTIDAAREAARILLGRLAAGFDPKAEREARKAEDARQRAARAAANIEAAFTLDTLISDWAAGHLATRRPRYAAEATRALRLAFARALAQPAAALTHDGVLAVLDGLAGAGKATTARLTMAYGRACYGWAVKRRRLAVNPFAGLPAIEGGGEARDRVLSAGEVGEVWRAAGKVPRPHGPMVRLALLTLARRDEVAGMRWGEVAGDLSAWTQPAARTKNGRAHVVHLSALARTVLREMLGAADGAPLPAMPPPDRLVFGLAKDRAITAHSWVKRTLQAHIDAARIDDALRVGGEPEAMPAWVLHDFRRSGVTWLADSGFPPHAADRLLNHVSGTVSGVAAVYQRSEFAAERMRALEVWGAHVLASADGAAGAGNVARLADARERRRA